MAAAATAWGLRHGLGHVLFLAGFLAVAGCSAAEPADSGEEVRVLPRRQVRARC